MEAEIAEGASLATVAGDDAREQDRYQYEHIKSTQIRLLTLDAGRRGDILHGQLTVVDIEELRPAREDIWEDSETSEDTDDDTYEGSETSEETNKDSSEGSDVSEVTSDHEYPIRYDALSYMWGDPTPTSSIFLDGKSLRIAANLTHALQFLRYVDRTLVIWADAICIDQTNLVERAEQVRLMRRVFSQADKVKIWINEPEIDETSEAIVALQEFCDVPEDVRRQLPDPAFWRPVLPIFNNPYWTRVWIQQEVINARQIDLHCMGIKISGTALLALQSALRGWDMIISRSPTLSSEWDDYGDFFLAKAYTPAHNVDVCDNGTREEHLYEILDSSVFLHLMDPRDRIYALMNLARDYVDGGIPVDYTKTELEVLIDAAAYHVSTHRNLNFLVSCFQGKIRTSRYAREAVQLVPTWLPQSWMGIDEDRGTTLDALRENEDLQTRCSPSAICIRTHRLQLLGFTVDVICNSLVTNFGSVTTINEFWNSLLGIHLQTFVDSEDQNVSYEAFQVLTQYHAAPKTRDYNSLVSGLCALFRLYQDEQTINTPIGKFFSNIKHLVDEVEYAGLCLLWLGICAQLVVSTKQGRLGLMPDCTFEEGDEIWIVLGSNVPLVLRPRPNGNYWHVCQIYVPTLLDDPVVQSLSSDAQSGDKVGEWAVTELFIE